MRCQSVAVTEPVVWTAKLFQNGNLCLNRGPLWQRTQIMLRRFQIFIVNASVSTAPVPNMQGRQDMSQIATSEGPHENLTGALSGLQFCQVL